MRSAVGKKTGNPNPKLNLTPDGFGGTLRIVKDCNFEGGLRFRPKHVAKGRVGLQTIGKKCSVKMKRLTNCKKRQEGTLRNRGGKRENGRREEYKTKRKQRMN